jgi:hypothetical protein
MTRAPSTEEPCAAKVSSTVLKTSGRGDPLAEFNRALKLIIRQRKNSLFYHNDFSAYVGSLLTSLIATCIQAEVNAMDYLVALQENRSAVFANPADWLPWTFQVTLASR